MDLEIISKVNGSRQRFLLFFTDLCATVNGLCLVALETVAARRPTVNFI